MTAAEARVPSCASPEKDDVEKQQPVDSSSIKQGAGCRPLEREIAGLAQCIRVAQERITMLAQSIEVSIVVRSQHTHSLQPTVCRKIIFMVVS